MIRASIAVRSCGAIQGAASGRGQRRRARAGHRHLFARSRREQRAKRRRAAP
jgi:hypothetical protein